jgi:hypothetical protein
MDVRITAADSPWRADVVYTLPAEFRRPIRVRCVGLLIVSAVLYASGRGAGLASLTSLIALVTGPLGLFYGLIYLWRGRFRTRVTAEGIEIRGYFNHFLPWREILGVEVRGYGPSMRIDDNYHSSYLRRSIGDRAPSVSVDISPSDRAARLATVRVVRANGSRCLLRAPLVPEWASDPQFDDKVRQLQKLCQQYGWTALQR